MYKQNQTDVADQTIANIPQCSRHRLPPSSTYTSVMVQTMAYHTRTPGVAYRSLRHRWDFRRHGAAICSIVAGTAVIVLASFCHKNV